MNRESLYDNFLILYEWMGDSTLCVKSKLIIWTLWYSDAALESPELLTPPLHHSSTLLDNEEEEEEGYEAFDEEEEPEEEEEGGEGQQLYKQLKAKRRYTRHRMAPKKTVHHKGFIDRNSVLLKDLRMVKRAQKEEEPVVQVFFTRNGELLGRVESVVPKGGFYPTISLGGERETVKVDLRPLSG